MIYCKSRSFEDIEVHCLVIDCLQLISGSLCVCAAADIARGSQPISCNLSDMFGSSPTGWPYSNLGPRCSVWNIGATGLCYRGGIGTPPPGRLGINPVFDLVEVSFNSGSTSRRPYLIDGLFVVQTNARLFHSSLCGRLRPHHLHGFGKDLLV